jgi:hypothetical protein
VDLRVIDFNASEILNTVSRSDLFNKRKFFSIASSSAERAIPGKLPSISPFSSQFALIPRALAIDTIFTVDLMRPFSIA